MKLGSAGIYPPGTLVSDTTGADVVSDSIDDVDVLVGEDTTEVLVDEAEDNDEDVEEDVDGEADGKPNGVEGVALGVDEAVCVIAADSVLVADTAGTVDEASIEAGAV